MEWSHHEINTLLFQQNCRFAQLHQWLNRCECWFIVILLVCLIDQFCGGIFFFKNIAFLRLFEPLMKHRNVWCFCVFLCLSAYFLKTTKIPIRICFYQLFRYAFVATSNVCVCVSWCGSLRSNYEILTNYCLKNYFLFRSSLRKP